MIVGLQSQCISNEVCNSCITCNVVTFVSFVSIVSLVSVVSLCYVVQTRVGSASGRRRRSRTRLAPLQFKEERISLCHPERSAGSLSGERSCAALRMTLLALRMTLLHRLRLTRTSSSLNCSGACLVPTIYGPGELIGSLAAFPRKKRHYVPDSCS